MTTFATLTGTGVPHPSPGRAGAGVCIRHEEIILQFDAGRGTVIRLSENKTPLHQISAVFLTHVHSDHVIDLADVVMTRWIQQTLRAAQPLEIVCPKGTPEAFVIRMLDPFEIDIALRVDHVQKSPPDSQSAAKLKNGGPEATTRPPKAISGQTKAKTTTTPGL